MLSRNKSLAILLVAVVVIVAGCSSGPSQGTGVGDLGSTAQASQTVDPTPSPTPTPKPTPTPTPTPTAKPTPKTKPGDIIGVIEGMPTVGDCIQDEDGPYDDGTLHRFVCAHTDWPDLTYKVVKVQKDVGIGADPDLPPLDCGKNVRSIWHAEEANPPPGMLASQHVWTLCAKVL